MNFFAGYEIKESVHVFSGRVASSVGKNGNDLCSSFASYFLFLNPRFDGEKCRSGTGLRDGVTEYGPSLVFLSIGFTVFGSLGNREVKLFGGLLDLLVAQNAKDSCQNVELSQSVLSSHSIRRLEFGTDLFGQLDGRLDTIDLL